MKKENKSGLTNGHVAGLPLSLVLVPLLCLTGALAGYIIPDALREDIITFSSFGICLLLLATITLFAVKIHRVSLSREKLGKNLPLMAVSAVIVFSYSQLDHRANKVILDELVLQASAMQLLYNNEYQAPQFSHNLSNELSLHQGMPDKRPPMYPVVLSLVHRLLGFSQGNGYLLNAALGFLALFFVGKVGMQIYPKGGGLIAILGMASIPLLSQNVTSQHLELLYLFLIACLFLTCLRISIRERNEELILAYLLAAAIALTRYEGLLFFMVPFAMHLLLALKKQAVPDLKAVYVACPICIAYIFTLVGYINSVPAFWQLEDLKNSSAFGIHYWPQNVGALFDFLFEVNRGLPGSFALSMLCLASLPITLLHIGKAISRSPKDGDALAQSAALAAMLLAMLLFLALIFSYHWGYVNSHLTGRFLLFPYFVMLASSLYALRREPFWLLSFALVLAVLGGVQAIFVDGSQLGFPYFLVLAGFVAMAIFCLKEDSMEKLPQAMVVFWVLFLVSESFPAINQRTYEDNYLPIPRTKIFIEWVEKHSGSNSVFISNSAFYGMLGKQSATTIERFNANPQRLLSLAGNNRFENVFVMQEVGRADDGKLIPYEDYVLRPEVEWETVEERRVVGDFGVRLIRVTGLKEAVNPAASE
ncbi:MAG: glycosyltransferase family 39 protein [Puniceicoccaceae bacterium]